MPCTALRQERGVVYVQVTSSPTRMDRMLTMPANASYRTTAPRAPIASLDLRKFLDTLRAETDRACAVLASSFLDSSLEAYFHATLTVDAPARLFEEGGALGSFAARIELAFALGMISDAERADLELVREIRDAFAHDDEYSLDFGTLSVAELCFRLRHSREFFDGSDAGDDPPPFPWLDESRANPRLRFEITVSFIRQAIVYRASRAAHATAAARAGA